MNFPCRAYCESTFVKVHLLKYIRQNSRAVVTKYAVECNANCAAINIQTAPSPHRLRFAARLVNNAHRLATTTMMTMSATTVRRYNIDN